MSSRTGRIHAGRLNGNGAPAVYYRYLKARAGQWIAVPELLRVKFSSAIGTRMAEIRDQLPLDESLECRKKKQPSGDWAVWYRLAVAVRETLFD